MQILVESQLWIFGHAGFSHVVFVYRSPLTIWPIPSFCFITALGADSNSEYSSESGVLLSDSRETSLAASWVHSAPNRDQGNRDYRGRSSGETSFKELDWEPTGGEQAEREAKLHTDTNQKRPEGPTQEWWGVVGGEE